MSEKSVIIIGAGIAGLAAGCYAQMNGYRTQIFEMHFKSGGLCTAWERKGYTIDGCLQWLWGSSPRHHFFSYWEEMGVVQVQKFIYMDELLRITKNGRTFIFYTDADRLEKHMKEIAPEDAAVIEEFAAAIRDFTRFNMPVNKAPEMFSPLDYLSLGVKLMPQMRKFRAFSHMTLGEMAQRFQNPFLREVWAQIWTPHMSVFNLLMSLAPMHTRAAGYPIGGSTAVIKAIEARYLGLGGKINFRQKVDRILVENGRAAGIRLADGSEHKADYVISAMDGHSTLFDLLEGKYLNEKVCGYYEKMPVFQPLVYIGLGVNRTFEKVPQMIAGTKVELDQPLVIGSRTVQFVMLRVHNFDPTLAPAGKTVITCEIESEFPYWEALRQDAVRYKAEKERIARAIIAALEKQFPGSAARVEMQDVATPVTFRRFTGNWQGSYEGWLPTPQTPPTFVMPKTLPGLQNFYMAGQWVMPGGGLPSGVITGRWVTQLLCKADRAVHSLQALIWICS